MHPSPTVGQTRVIFFLFEGFQPTINKCTFLLQFGHLFCVYVYRACVHVGVHVHGCPYRWKRGDNFTCFLGAIDLIFLVRVFDQDPGLIG